MTVHDIIRHLRASGYAVTTENVPGLYRIDGGPELTTSQLHQVGERLIAAMEEGAPAMEWVRPNHFVLWD